MRDAAARISFASFRLASILPHTFDPPPNLAHLSKCVRVSLKVSLTLSPSPCLPTYTSSIPRAFLLTIPRTGHTVAVGNG
jgi:hypothetical protein